MTEFKTKVGSVGCHTVNIGELLMQIDTQFAVGDDPKIKIPVEKLPLFIGLLWSKIQETFRECEGREVEIDFGDSAGANAIENLLKLALTLLPKEKVNEAVAKINA